MRVELEDLQTAWHAQPTTFFRLTPQQMRAGVDRIDQRQRRVARGIVAAFVGDVISFTLLLFLFVTNAIQAVGCVWIMLAMGWFARYLWTHLRTSERTRDEMIARPSIDAFRAALNARWTFYRSLLAFGVVLPGVALLIIGGLIAAPGSGKSVAATVVVIVAAIANGFRLHLPNARAVQRQLAELDEL
ncbi:MAG TPA: hypothetical protein VGM82_24470 [Gemmatimonadaceae bacterium]|jgi:hypothetical protein